MSSARHPPARWRGVALITAMILVTLATVVAVALGTRTALTARRQVAAVAPEHALQYAIGAESLAAYVLREDNGPQDTLQDSWTQPYGPVEAAPGVMLEAQLLDEQSRFNLNTLVDAQGAIDPQAVAIFSRLLELVGLETKWAPLLADWIDSDVLATQDGGEDALYLSQQPGHRAANQALTSTSELLQLPGFGRERFLKLAPHVAALPPEARRINVCLASGVVLDALAATNESAGRGVEYSLMTGEALAQARSRGCFPGVSVLQATLGPQIEGRVGESSQYFGLRSGIQLGQARFAMYSLLKRDGGRVLTVLRQFGTE
ncbi:MAG: hypothetical protein RL026_2622 [Pseudomonadota bacterium]